MKKIITILCCLMCVAMNTNVYAARPKSTATVKVIKTSDMCSDYYGFCSGNDTVYITTYEYSQGFKEYYKHIAVNCVSELDARMEELEKYEVPDEILLKYIAITNQIRLYNIQSVNASNESNAYFFMGMAERAIGDLITEIRSIYI